MSAAGPAQGRERPLGGQRGGVSRKHGGDMSGRRRVGPEAPA
jgi:hypothetical protein